MSLLYLLIEMEGPKSVLWAQILKANYDLELLFQYQLINWCIAFSGEKFAHNEEFAVINAKYCFFNDLWRFKC